MKLAVQYSEPLAELVKTGQVTLDYFKCPAWPDLVQQAQAIRPTYVHLPLQVGRPDVDVYDFETKAPVDWGRMERILTLSDTTYVNVHLSAPVRDYPDIPLESTDPAHVELLAERNIAGIEAAIQHFGAERVIAENTHHSHGDVIRAIYMPDVTRRVIETTGCGFLLDISHARLAARHLGQDARAYISALPLEHVREVHFTGIQRLDGAWLAALQETEGAAAFAARYGGRVMDHLPLTEADWDDYGWMLAQIRSGAWAEPWVVALEVGGVGHFWGEVATRMPYLEQVPRLYAELHG